MSYKVLVYGVSDIGLVRRNNEDAWKLLQEEQFYLLADGMGGHQAGEVASKECIEHLSSLFEEQFDPSKTLDETQQLLYNLIQQINEIIYRLANRDIRLKGMGTTLCCLLLHRDGLIYAHVGDSRIYRFRHHKLEQLTNDHSLLRELIDLGQLSEQQAEDFLYKNIITKAIGTEITVHPSVKTTPVETGDIFLMCTDGLSDLLSVSEMEMILTESSEEKMVPNLIERAKQKGGFDNITVVLLKILEKNEPHLF